MTIAKKLAASALMALSGAAFAAGGAATTGVDSTTTDGAGGAAGPGAGMHNNQTNWQHGKAKNNTSGYGSPGMTGSNSGQSGGNAMTPSRTPNGTNTGEMRNGQPGQ